MAEATIRVKAIGVYEDILTDLNKAERAISRSRLGINRRSVVEPLGRMAQSASEFEKSLAASNARVIAFGASVGIISGMQKAFSELVKQTIAVEKALTDIQVVLNTTPKNLEKFSKDLFSIAKNTGNSFFDVAQAALEFSRQGLGAQETLKRVNDAMILVRLSGVDATKAIEGLTSILNSFQDVALDTTKIINKLATVDAAFAISSGDLVEAFSRVGSAAQDAGLNLDELIGIVTAARQITGRSGSVIGNSLKTIFTRLQRSDTLDALEGLGVATRDANGGFRDAISLLTDLSNKYTDLNDAQKAYVSELVGGVFQINVLKATLGDLSREFSVYGNAVSISTNATDEAIKRNEVLNRTLSAQANSLKNTVVQLFSSLGQAGLDKPVKVFIDLAQKLTSTLNEAVGEETGGSFAKGLIKGLGNFISGPGLAIVGGVLVKLFLTTSKFAVTSLKSLLSIGDETSKIKNLQSQINALLAEQNTSYSQILARTGDRVAAEKEILRIIQQQQIARHTSMSGVGASLYRQGLRYTDDKGFTTTFKGNLPASKLRAVRGAEGILPAIVKEKMATNKGVGGASSAAKPVVIKDFNFGQGKKGTVVANTDEYIVPNFAGGDGHAIFNKHMVRKYGLPAGAKRITTAAQGLVNDVQEIETDKGRIILGFQGKTGIIQNIGTSYPGQGATRDLYQKAFDIARARGVQSIQGNLWKQNHKVPRGKSPLDWVKGTIPQIIRGRYGKSSTLTIDGRKINLAGGELFDEDLKKKSGHIASLLDRAEGIDYVTNLASGRLPKELSGQAISRLKYFLSDGNVKVTNDSDTRDRFIRHNGTDSINISGNPIGKYGSSFVLAHEAGHYAHAISDRLDFSRAALSKDYFKKLSSERLANQNALTLISAFGDKKDAKAYKNFSRLQMLRGYKLPYISKIFGEKGIKGLGDILKVGLYPSYASGYISNHALGSPYPTRGLPHAYMVGTNKGFFSFKKKKEATAFAKKVSSKIIYPINNKFDHLGNENKVTSVEEALSRYGNFASGFVPGNKYRFKRQSAGDLLFNQFGSEEQALEYFLGIAGGDPRVLLQARASLGARGSDTFSFLESLSSLRGISNRKGQRIYEKKIEEMALRNQLAGIPRKLQASGSRALNLPDFNRGELVNMRFFLQGKGKNFQNFAQIKKFLGRPTPVVTDRDIRQQRNRFDLQEQLSRVLGAPFLSNEYSQFEKELQAEISKVNSRGDADSELRKATLAARFPKLLNRGPSGPLANIPPRTKSGGGGFGGGGGGNVPPSAGGFEFDDEEARYFREILQGRRARFANNRNRNAGNQASLGANFNFRGKDFANYFAGNFGAGLNSFQPLAASIAYPGYFQDMLRADKRNRPARARITQTTYGKTRGAYDFSTQTTDVERGFGGNVNELTNVQLSGLLGRAVGSKDRATAVRDLRERLFRQVSIKEGKVSAQPVRDIAKFNKEVFGGQNLQQTFLEEVRKNIQQKGTGLATAIERATKETFDLGATQDQINKYIAKNGKVFDRIQREYQQSLEEEAKIRKANASAVKRGVIGFAKDNRFKRIDNDPDSYYNSKDREFYKGELYKRIRRDLLEKNISSFNESSPIKFSKLSLSEQKSVLKSLNPDKKEIEKLFNPRYYRDVPKTSAEIGRMDLDLFTTKAVRGMNPMYSSEYQSTNVNFLRRTLNRGFKDSEYTNVLSKMSDPSNKNFEEIFEETTKKELDRLGSSVQNYSSALTIAGRKIISLGATMDLTSKIAAKLNPSLSEYRVNIIDQNKAIRKYFLSQKANDNFLSISNRISSGGSVSNKERKLYENTLQKQFLQRQLSDFEKQTGVGFYSLNSKQRSGLVSKLKAQNTGFQDFLFQQRVSELETQNLKPSGAFGGIFQRALNRASDPLTSRRILAQEKALGEFGGKLSPQELQLRKQELDDLKKQRSNALKGRLQNAGLGVSLGLSVGAGFAKEGSVLGGALQGASLGATGFLVSGPFGIISTVAGGVIGAANALKDKLKPSVEQLAAAAQANAEQFARTSEAFTGYLQTLSRMDEGFRKGNLKPIEEEILNRELGKNLSIISGQNPGIAKQIEEAGRTRNFEALGGIQAQLLREGQRTKDQLELRALFANEVNQLTDKDFRKNFDYSNRYTTGVLAGPTVTRSLNLSDKRLEGYGSVAKSAVTVNALYTDENLTKFKGLNQDDALKQVFGENYKTDENVKKFLGDIESIKVLMGLITKEAEEQNALWKLSQKTIEENKKAWERVSVIVSRINQIGFDTQLSTLQKFNNQSNNINLRRGLIDSQVGLDPSLRSRLQTGLDIKQIGLEKETSLQELNAGGYKELVALFEDSRNDAGLKMVEEQRKQGKDVIDTLKRLIDSSIGSVDELKKIQQEVVNQKALLEENVRAQIEIKRTGLNLDLANIKADRLRGLIGGQSPLDVYRNFKDNPDSLKEIFGKASDRSRLSIKNTINTNKGITNYQSIIDEAIAIQDEQRILRDIGIAPNDRQINRYQMANEKIGSSFFKRLYGDQLKGAGASEDILRLVETGDVRNVDKALGRVSDRLKIAQPGSDSFVKLQEQQNVLQRYRDSIPRAAKAGEQLGQDLSDKITGGKTLKDLHEAITGIKEDDNIRPTDSRFEEITVLLDNLGRKAEGRILNFDKENKTISFERAFDKKLFEVPFAKLSQPSRDAITSAADEKRVQVELQKKLEAQSKILVDKMTTLIEEFSKGFSEAGQNYFKAELNKRITVALEGEGKNITAEEADAIIKELQAIRDTLLKNHQETENLKRAMNSKIPLPPK